MRENFGAGVSGPLFQYTDFDYSRFSGDSEFWADISAAGKQYRVGLGQNAAKPPLANGRISVNLIAITFKEAIKIPPLFIGSQRNLIYTQIQDIQREKPVYETQIEYANNSLPSLYGSNQVNIKQWLINRYFMIEKEWAAREKKNWDHFVSTLPKIAPFDSDFSYIRTGRDFEPVFSIYGKECYLEELSAGYQAVLSIIVNIIALVEGCREEANRDIQTASGTVCIDEPDIHLHPEWQLTLLRQGLVSLFPHLQFIVTTHSPHLLASAGPGEIICMPKAYTEACYNLVPDEKVYSDWTTDEILADVMEVTSLDNKDYERLVTAAMNASETKDIAALKAAIANLEKVNHPDNTIVMVLRTKLASLELTKND
jgi:hypothetical protein